MTNEKLDELERLLKAATPGPWIFHDLRTEKEWEGDQSYSISVGLGFIDDAKYYPSAPSFDEAALICAAINALPELVARVRELEALIELKTDAANLASDVIEGKISVADAREKAAELRARSAALQTKGT